MKTFTGNDWESMYVGMIIADVVKQNIVKVEIAFYFRFLETDFKQKPYPWGGIVYSTTFH